MKNKQVLLILFIFVLSLFSTTSFADTNNISTYSPNCILMESSSGKIIYEKNAFSPVPPASTTKIMTAILTLEHCNLTDIATVSYEAINSVPVSYTHAYLVEGEELTINELLHILLIPSANDAANVLAEHIAGSVSSFASMMNAKALELGCKNTNFVNPNGVHATKHYSTAYDLALMGRYAMQNETFRKIVSITDYTLPATNKYPEANRSFKSTNLLIRSDISDSTHNYYYSYTTGVKTGYTNAAKDCIVASATKDGIEYIVVILGADETEDGLSARYTDCINLFNYAFKYYTTYVINDENSILEQLQISNADFFYRNLNVIVKDKITLLLKNDTDINTITPNVEFSSDLKAPIAKDTVIGTISYNIDGNTYSSDLLAGSDIAELDLLNTSLTIGSILLAILLLYFLIRSGNGKKSKKGRRRA